jgi:hypothetical protein
MRLALVTAALCASACAAPGFVANTGRVTPPSVVRVTAGAGYHASADAADEVRAGRDAARALPFAAQPCPTDPNLRCWSLADVTPVVDAAVRYAVAAPLQARVEVEGRYGVAPGFDAGLRFGPGLVGADLGVQLFGPRDPVAKGWAGTVLGGYQRRSIRNLGEDLEDVIDGDATLQDFQVTFVAGRQWRRTTHLYGGARWQLTRWSVTAVPTLPIVYEDLTVARAFRGTDHAGNVQLLSAVVGGALGYDGVKVGLELNLVETIGSARVLDRTRNLNGFGLLPAVWVSGQY